MGRKISGDSFEVQLDEADIFNSTVTFFLGSELIATKIHSGFLVSDKNIGEDFLQQQTQTGKKKTFKTF